MTPKAKLEAFAQKVYLIIKNRYFDDIEGDDGQVFVQQVVDWTNMFLDELENEVGPDGQVVDWWFSRSAGFELATGLTEGNASISVPNTVERLITDEERYVQIQQGGITVSNWRVVHPKDITNRSDRITADMCAQVGSSIVFSRAFRDTEAGGTVVGDVATKLLRLAYNLVGTAVTPTNIKVLDTVRPQLLLSLGVAKNATLPDIVQGKLSPSYAQKFNDLLQGAVARSTATSVSAQATRDDFSGVRGTY